MTTPNEPTPLTESGRRLLAVVAQHRLVFGNDLMPTDPAKVLDAILAIEQEARAAGRAEANSGTPEPQEAVRRDRAGIYEAFKEIAEEDGALNPDAALAALVAAFAATPLVATPPSGCDVTEASGRWAFLNEETGEWVEVKPGVVLLASLTDEAMTTPNEPTPLTRCDDKWYRAALASEPLRAALTRAIDLANPHREWIMDPERLAAERVGYVLEYDAENRWLVTSNADGAQIIARDVRGEDAAYLIAGYDCLAALATPRAASALDVERLRKAITAWYRTPVNVSTTRAADSARWIAAEYAALATQPAERGEPHVRLADPDAGPCPKCGHKDGGIIVGGETRPHECCGHPDCMS